MDLVRQATAAVSNMSQSLGSSFDLDAVQGLAEQMAEIHQSEVARLRELAGQIGAPQTPEDSLHSLGWRLAIKEAARFIAIGMEFKRGSQQ